MAENLRERMGGLIGRPDWPARTALVFPRCRAIHTAFMRWPLDVVFLDRTDRIVRLVWGLRPWRYAWGGEAARIAIEILAGNLPAEIRQGELLHWDGDGITSVP